MSLRDVICLANARKKGGRCVAGLTLDGGGWIRAVSRIPDGVLFADDFTLADCTEPKPLDVIRINLDHPTPAIHQPENWEIGQGRWLRSEQADPQIVSRFLERYLFRGSVLMGNLDDRCYFFDYYNRPAPNSLTLIAPPELTLYSTKHRDGRVQSRGNFLLGPEAIYYDLPVTDPLWEPRIEKQPIRLRQSEQPFALTISLSEPFADYCYKLIAAIFLI